MQHYNKSQRCCATCANWAGPRQAIGTNIKQSEVSSSNVHGKCYDNPRVGGYVDGPPASYCCSHYQPWAAIK